MSTYRIIHVCVDKQPEVKEIEGGEKSIGLEALEQLVGGGIEFLPLYFGGEEFTFYIHEMGRYVKDCNRLVMSDNGESDIYGDFVICSGDAEGNSISLGEKQAEKMLEAALSWPVAL